MEIDPARMAADPIRWRAATLGISLCPDSRIPAAHERNQTGRSCEWIMPSRFPLHFIIAPTGWENLGETISSATKTLFIPPGRHPRKSRMRRRQVLYFHCNRFPPARDRSRVENSRNLRRAEALEEAKAVGPPRSWRGHWHPPRRRC